MQKYYTPFNIICFGMIFQPNVLKRREVTYITMQATGYLFRCENMLKKMVIDDFKFYCV